MNSEGILVTDNVYCLNITKLPLARTIAENLNLDLICYGYHFKRDILSWEGCRLMADPGTVTFKFLEQDIMIIRNGKLYKENLGYIYKYGRQVAEIEAMNIMLRYLPYDFLTIKDLEAVQQYINYNLPPIYDIHKGTCDTCEFNTKHGSIFIQKDKPVIIKNKYGTAVLPEQLGYIANGRMALEYLVEGRYRLDTILYNNKFVNKGDGQMLIEEIVYDTIDMLKINPKFTKGEEVAIGIDPDTNTVVLVNLKDSDIIECADIGDNNALEIMKEVCKKHYGEFSAKEDVLDEFLVRYVMPEEVMV